MASTTAVCDSFKTQLPQAKHNFLLSGGDTFKIALYTSSATHDRDTTIYSVTNEISGTGYTAAGATLTRIDPFEDGQKGIIDLADISWTSATITAASCLIHNTTNVGAVSVHNFGGDKTVTSGTFTLQMPVADATTGLIRIA